MQRLKGDGISADPLPVLHIPRHRAPNRNRLTVHRTPVGVTPFVGDGDAEHAEQQRYAGNADKYRDRIPSDHI